MSLRSVIQADFRRYTHGKDMLHDVVYLPAYDQVDFEEEYQTADRIWAAMEQIKASYPQYFVEPALVEDTIAVIDEVILDCNKVGKQQAQEKIIISNARLDRCFYGSKRGHRKGCKAEYKDHRRNLAVN